MQRHSRLIRSISQKDTKVVLSLGGGGMRMFAHTAAFRFIERLGMERQIDEIWGSSGGAIIGLYYSRGMEPDEIITESKQLINPSMSLRLTPTPFEVIKNVLRDLIFGIQKEKSLEGFVDIQNTFREMMRSALSHKKAVYPLYCLAYNMKYNRTDVLSAQPIPKGLYGDFIYETNPLDAVIASSAIPILFVPKIISDKNGRRTYVDGATNEEVPTVSIYKKWLRDKEIGLETHKRILVISVDLHPDIATIGILEHPLIQRIPAYKYIMMLIKLSDLMRKARINEQKRILMNDPNVEIWDINFRFPGYGLMNVEAIPEIIRKAEHSFPQQFAKINDSLLG